MAYKAEIQIVAKGQETVQKMEQALTRLDDQVNSLASQRKGSLFKYNEQLKKASELLAKAAVHTDDETTAIKLYFDALSNANTEQARQNRLLDAEIKKRGLATGELKKYNAAALPPRSRTSMAGGYLRPQRIRGQTAFADPIGPGPVSSTALSSQLPYSQMRMRNKQLLAEEQALQEGLRRLEEKSAATLNKKLETQGRINAATADEVRLITQRVTIQKGEAVAFRGQIGPGPVAAMPDPNQFRGKFVGPRAPRGTRAAAALTGLGLPTAAAGVKGLARGGAAGGIGKFLGRVGPGAVLGAAFPLLMGGDPTEAIGGGAGALLGGAIAGPMGAFAGGLVGQLIGQRVSEAKKLNKEAERYKELTESIEKVETRILTLSMKAVRARREGNEQLAVELDRKAENARIAFDQFKQQTQLDLDERNKTKAGKRLIGQMKQRVFLEARRQVQENNALSALKQKDAILKMEMDKVNHLARMEQKRVDIRKAISSNIFKVQSAELSAALQVNSLEMQRAKNKKDITRQFDLQVQRARLIYKQTLLQVQQEVTRVRLARISANIELNRLQIELNRTKAAGKDTTLQKQSVELQRQSLVLANLNVTAAEKAAAFQIQGARAVRDAAIEQVRFDRKQSVSTNNIRPFAEGGYVTRPTNALIGEAGESEYVIPSSKMNTAMQRYSAGVRGEGVTAGAVGAGSTTSANYSSQQNMYYGGGGASVNITTGPVIRMDNRDYVAMSDLQRGMATAANAGQANMMRDVSRSYATRRSMGL